VDKIEELLVDKTSDQYSSNVEYEEERQLECKLQILTTFFY
jgi:hypothetical protein